MNRLIRTEKIYKSYYRGETEVKVLKNVSLYVNEGESVCITGPSGSGKSTLLHILGLLDRASSGNVYFNEANVKYKNDDELAKLRNKSIGFVFQFHYLLSEFNVLENVALPAELGGVHKAEAFRRAKIYLDQLEMSHRLTHYPLELSGGEQQRVAIARALIQRPKIVFADEPTGNLDSVNGNRIQKIFFELQKEYNMALVVVSHDLDFASNFTRRLTLDDGKLTEH